MIICPKCKENTPAGLYCAKCKALINQGGTLNSPINSSLKQFIKKQKRKVQQRDWKEV